jgi:hypothetical protein
MVIFWDSRGCVLQSGMILLRNGEASILVSASVEESHAILQLTDVQSTETLTHRFAIAQTPTSLVFRVAHAAHTLQLRQFHVCVLEVIDVRRQPVLPNQLVFIRGVGLYRMLGRPVWSTSVGFVVHMCDALDCKPRVQKLPWTPNHQQVLMSDWILIDLPLSAQCILQWSLGITALVLLHPVWLWLQPRR